MSHLERRLAKGCGNGTVLWRELRGMGFAGGNKQVHRWLAERRTVPAKVGRRRAEDTHRARASTDRGKAPPLIAARHLAWLLVQSAAALVSRVEQDRDAAVAANRARRFTALVCAWGLIGRTSGGAPAKPGSRHRTGAGFTLRPVSPC